MTQLPKETQKNRDTNKSKRTNKHTKHKPRLNMHKKHTRPNRAVWTGPGPRVDPTHRNKFSMDLLTPNSPGDLPNLSLTPIAPDYIGGGSSCLSSALWCQYPKPKPLVTKIKHMAHGKLPMYSVNARDHFNCSPLLFTWPAPRNRCGQTEGDKIRRSPLCVSAGWHQEGHLTCLSLHQNQLFSLSVLTLFFQVNLG